MNKIITLAILGILILGSALPFYLIGGDLYDIGSILGAIGMLLLIIALAIYVFGYQKIKDKDNSAKDKKAKDNTPKPIYQRPQVSDDDEIDEIK